MNVGNRIAVVTGAGGGIGGALVQALADRDARAVVACDLDVAGVEELRGTVGPDRVVARELDVTDPRATEALADEVERTVGPIDLWFANAGIATGSGLDAPDGEWEKQWNVNVMAHLYAARTMVPRWVERGEGHLVSTASMAGILTAAGDGAYSTTKHAAVGFAEWLAYTYQDQGIKVSCVCPGAVDTAMLKAGAQGDATKASAAIGAGEVLSAEEASERIVAGVQRDDFLVLTHPEMKEYAVGKAQDPARWVKGMARLWARAQTLLDRPEGG
jgi:NAD(P)-dependent dehydrogenase (short-subunit alcohol dehydrogenase family)